MFHKCPTILHCKEHHSPTEVNLELPSPNSIHVKGKYARLEYVSPIENVANAVSIDGQFTTPNRTDESHSTCAFWHCFPRLFLCGLQNEEMSYKTTALMKLDEHHLILAFCVFTEDGRSRSSISGIWCYTWSHTYLHSSVISEKDMLNPTVVDRIR